MPRGRAAILILDLNIDSKSSSNSRATLARPLRIASAHHQTVFEPPFMTSIGPAIGVHERRQRYPLAPRAPETFGSESERVRRPWGQRLATSRNPSVGVQMLSDPCGGVESPVD